MMKLRNMKKLLNRISLGFSFLNSFTTRLASNSINLPNIEARNISCSNLMSYEMSTIPFDINNH